MRRTIVAAALRALPVLRRAIPICLTAAFAVGPIARDARAADPAHPTVVELFTAQGCAACPPAQAAINALADRPDLIVLTFSVTYWDSLGWKDAFAKPGFTERQRDYDRAGHRAVQTPQVILNGVFAVVGNEPAALRRAIDTADRGMRGPAIRRRGAGIDIGADPRGARDATVWLVRYDPRIIRVAIAAGENGGRTLPHRDVVRQLARLGPWRGAAARFAVPRSADPHWRTAILVQGDDGGAIVAATRID